MPRCLPVGSALSLRWPRSSRAPDAFAEKPLVLSLALNLSLLATGANGGGRHPSFGIRAQSQGAAFPFLLGRWAAMGLVNGAVIALTGGPHRAISAGVAKAYQSGPPAIIATFDYGYLVFARSGALSSFSELRMP